MCEDTPMNPIIAISISVILYFLATFCQIKHLYKLGKPSLYLAWSFSFIAICMHGWVLHHWIDLPTGQNLNFLNILSMVIWLAALLTILSNLRLPVLNLGLFIFPLAALSIIAIVLFPSTYVLNTAHHPKALIHVLLSVLAFSFMCIAAIQAIFVAIQEYSLRKKQTGLIQTLLPLETMESFLFQTIAIGFILLTIVLLTAIIFFHHIFAPDILQKTLLTITSWIIFGALLFGRYIAGWRGKIAIRGTLLGFILLLLAYFGSKIFIATTH